eukprot:607273-Rhodomonas_salina.1
MVPGKDRKVRFTLFCAKTCNGRGWGWNCDRNCDRNGLPPPMTTTRQATASTNHTKKEGTITGFTCSNCSHIHLLT